MNPLDRLDPISLIELTEKADLQTRVDRKYTLPVTDAPTLLGRVPPDTRVFDVGPGWTDTDGHQPRPPEIAVVETKTGSAPSPINRLLWAGGHRPVPISQYATGARRDAARPARHAVTTHPAPVLPPLPGGRRHRHGLMERLGRCRDPPAFRFGNSSSSPPVVCDGSIPGGTHAMKPTARRTAMLVGLTAVLLNGPFATAALAAPTATITLNGSSATVSGSNVTVSGGAITITAPGSYAISGTLSNGYVKVDTTAAGTVELLLNGASITNSSSSALQVANADAVTVTLSAGTSNTLTDASTYTNTDEPDAALFSTADLAIAGTGALTVRGNHQDGIASKDDLVIQSGTITVTSVDDAIRGKDSLTINGGTVNVTSTSGDGLKSNETETGKGIVNITNGTITVSAADDGVKGQNTLNISGGTVNVTRSYEALEAMELTISGGTTNVVSSDDSVNAVEEGLGDFVPSTKAFIKVTGGTVTANSGKDGFDSNGSLTLAGGTVVVNGPTSGARGGDGALDADGTLSFTGGTVLGAGMTSLAVFNTVPATGQGWVAPVFSTNQRVGTIVHIVSGSTVLASFKSSKTFYEVVYSSSRITNGQSYDIYTGGSVSGTSTGGLHSSGSISGATKTMTVTAGRYSRSTPRP